MALESDLPDVEEFDTEDLGNGAAAEHVENGAQSTGANGQVEQSAAPARPTITLPKRRQRATDKGTAKPSQAETVATVPAPEPEQVTAPASVERVTPPRPSVADRVFRLVVNYEGLIYLGIFLLAIVTRLWDLGDRGIHHDESLHSVYSRNLYIGTGYQHDPMMHGPLQFHLIAAMYWLFGDTDATARLASAFCGIFVVMSPFFLRKQMGRWPALVASFLFLISPSILYFSRMAREDSIFSGMEMIMIVGLWRFISTRRPADFFITMAGLSLMFTIKETSYLSVAVMGGFFVLMFAFQSGWAIFGSLAAYGAVLGGFYKIISDRMKAGEVGALPNIPATNPDYNTIMAFVRGILAHPLVQGAIVITLVYLAVLVALFYWKRRQVMYEDAEPAVEIRRRPARTASGEPTRALPSRKARPAAGSIVASEEAHSPNGHAAAEDIEAPDGERFSEDALEVWDPKRLDAKPGTLLAHYEPGSLPYLLGSLFARPSVIVIGLLIASAIFVVLYSVFFTDLPRGIASGLFASLGYWMAQHGVERGGQPWYYYSLLIPLYEPIAVFFSLCAAGFFGVKGVRGIFRRRERLYETGEPGLGLFNTDREIPFAKFSVFLPAFTIWWLAGAFFIYSWAGEKMPWLMIHMVRPAILLAALFLGALVASILRRRQERLAMAPAYEVVPIRPTVVEEVPASAVPTRRSRSGSAAAVPARRGDGRRAQPARIEEPVRAVQDPPWVAWNRPGSRFPVLFFVIAFTVLAMAWGMKMNALTNLSDYAGWGATWVYPGLMVILTVSFAVWLGPGRALRYLALGIFAVMFLYQVRSAVNLTYQHPDVPIEMAVYVQTSPDVTRTVDELNEYSYYATGTTDTKVVYDNFTSWPFEWYLRNYKNKQFVGGGDPPVGPDVPVMFLEYAKHSNDPKLSDYVVQRYAMRWWFPEEWYKQQFIPGLDPKTAPFLNQIGAALNTMKVSVTEPQLQSQLWKYLSFRETPMPLGSEDMVLVLRKDIAQVWHRLQYEPPQVTDIP
jgi:predicted membrane-bound mannosyltransferase